jgi:hypothetical protein
MGHRPTTDLADAHPDRIRLGIDQAVSLLRRGTFRLAFGSGDYRRETGTSADELVMAHPRSRLVVATRIGSPPRLCQEF